MVTGMFLPSMAALGYDSIYALRLPATAETSPPALSVRAAGCRWFRLQGDADDDQGRRPERQDIDNASERLAAKRGAESTLIGSSQPTATAPRQWHVSGKTPAHFICLTPVSA
jgi:hypothetical protein